MLDDRAVLMFEMPTCCCDCVAYCNENEMCMATDDCYEVIPTEKPDWCPIFRLPIHKKPLNKKGYRSGYIEGWNDCLDSISEGKVIEDDNS